MILCNLCHRRRFTPAIKGAAWFVESFAFYATYAPLLSMPPMPADYPSPQWSRLVCPKLRLYATYAALQSMPPMPAVYPSPKREPPGLAQALQSMQNHAIQALFKTIAAARCYFQKPDIESSSHRCIGVHRQKVVAHSY